MSKTKGFLNFIREQGVVGLAVGFILGGAVSKMVASIVEDLINPFLGLVLGMAGGFRESTITVAGAKIMTGNFFGSFIDFLVIALVVYFGVKLLKLDRLDKK